MTTSSRDRSAARAAPCAKCPFRSDVPIYLRRGRRHEIRLALLDGQGFTCHETTVPIETEDGTEMAVTSDSQQCAGAIKSIFKGGGDTNHIRVMARLGLIDPDAIEATGAQVWDINDWVSAAEGDTAATFHRQPVIPCAISNAGCEAPAGYLVGGAVVLGDTNADHECVVCGDPVCGNCLNGQTACPYCTEDHR